MLKLLLQSCDVCDVLGTACKLDVAERLWYTLSFAVVVAPEEELTAFVEDAAGVLIAAATRAIERARDPAATPLQQKQVPIQVALLSAALDPAGFLQQMGHTAKHHVLGEHKQLRCCISCACMQMVAVSCGIICFA